MRYFITGATGFIGGRIAHMLRAAGDEVTAVVRNPDRAAALRALGVTLYQGDVTDRASLVEPMRGADGVFHIAAWYEVGVRDTSPAEQINVEGTRNVLDVMRELEISRGVYTSSLAVNSDTRGKIVDESYYFAGMHLSLYDETKWRAHYEVALPMTRDGLPLMIVMPGLVYGEGDHSAVRRTLVQYLQRRLPVIPAETAFCWAYVDDVAQGHILAMQRGTPGETYIIAGEPHTLVDALRLAQNVTAIPVPTVVPPAMLRLTAAFTGLLAPFVRLPQDYHPEYLRVSAGTTYLGDNAKARRELGYAPRSLADGLPPVLRHEQAVLQRQL